MVERVSAEIDIKARKYQLCAVWAIFDRSRTGNFSKPLCPPKVAMCKRWPQEAELPEVFGGQNCCTEIPHLMSPRETTNSLLFLTAQELAQVGGSIPQALFIGTTPIVEPN